MPGGDFLDSNVIVYLFDPPGDRKRRIAQDLIDLALSGSETSISFQVVQETLNVITMRAPRRATPEEARVFLEDVLVPLWRVMPTQDLYERALRIQERYAYSFYDSLIIAAAVEGGCDRLLSEDLQHGQRIDGVTITNPFLV